VKEAPTGTLLLTGAEIATLLTLPEYIDIMEEAFASHAEGRSFGLGLLHEHSEHVEYHFKAGGLAKDGRSYYALKANSFSFVNAKEYGLPSIMGAILLLSGDMAFPLACMESGVITGRRTGATGALAARYLSREDSSTALICGAGRQAGNQLEFLTKVRTITKVYVWSPVREELPAFVEQHEARLGVEILPVEAPSDASKDVDIIITATPATGYYLTREDVSSGTFIAAMGADSENKQEIDPRLMAENKLVTDMTSQCVTVGEFHHAIDQGLMTEDDVHATIGEVVTGQKPGRESRDEIIVFDSTGTALQDAAAAIACYTKAVETGVGTVIKL